MGSYGVPYHNQSATTSFVTRQFTENLGLNKEKRPGEVVTNSKIANFLKATPVARNTFVDKYGYPVSTNVNFINLGSPEYKRFTLENLEGMVLGYGL